MKLNPTILVVVSALTAAPAHAGSQSVTMGVGLTVVADCRAASCGASPRSAGRAQIHAPYRVSNAPHSLTTRSASATSFGIATITY